MSGISVMVAAYFQMEARACVDNVYEILQRFCLQANNFWDRIGSDS